MREIKFRAWDKKEKKMFYFDIFEISASGAVCGEGENCCDITYPYIILMQYIGLKDKNGKEIYEGDIILKFIKGNTEIKFDPFEVRWHPITCGWNITGKRGHYYEKIGNIYENPELL